MSEKYYTLKDDFKNRYDILNNLTPEEVQEQNTFNNLKNKKYFNPIEHEYAIGYYLFSNEKVRQLDKNKYTNLFLYVLNINPSISFVNLKIPNISTHIPYVNKLNSYDKQILLDLIKYYKTFKIDTKTSYSELVSRFVSFFNLILEYVLDILIGQEQSEDEAESGIYTIRNWFIFFISFQRDFFKRNFQHRLMCLLDIQLYKKFATNLDLLFNHKVLKGNKTYFDTFPGTSDTTYQFFNITYYDALKNEFNIDLNKIVNISTSDEFYEFISKVRGKTVTERDRLNEQNYLFLNNLTIKEYADQKRNINKVIEVQNEITDSELINQLKEEQVELILKNNKLQSEINELKRASQNSATVYFDLKDLVTQEQLNDLSHYIYNSLPIIKNQDIRSRRYTKLINRYITLLKKYKKSQSDIATLTLNITELTNKTNKYESTNLEINDDYLTIKKKLDDLTDINNKNIKTIKLLEDHKLSVSNELYELHNKTGALNNTLNSLIKTIKTMLSDLEVNVKPDSELLLKEVSQLKIKNSSDI